MINKNLAFLIILVINVVFIPIDSYASDESLIDTSALTLSSISNQQVEEHPMPDIFMVIPFITLLLMIATGPLFYHKFWEKHYPKIAILLGLITVGYYLIVLHDTHTPLHTLDEYISFIALLGSLFVASGGILIKIDRKSTPMLNSVLFLFGAVIANIIGTTGASMLLIRPFLKLNKDRIKPYHIIFFIFIVSNIGGALTPIGDPPLFLGFLKGVEFFWVIGHVWYIWLPTVITIISIFYFIDSRNMPDAASEIKYSNKIEFKGIRSVFFLAIIIVSVFIDPAVIDWVPSFDPLPIGIREIIMLSIIFIAYKSAPPEILAANEFDFEPIKEVAYLFVGIFATMMPALQIIANESNIYGQSLTPGIFYWATGSLSAFLDNAPTYLNFLSAAMGKFNFDINIPDQVLQFELAHPIYLSAVSVAAVFFGAMTYIGNGPNFMVKSISERAGIRMPSFFGFLFKYAVPVLLPIFTLVWLVFYFGKV
ncbi:MAG TPA: sodium:proton antiporter [Ignavibacteriaceae bacterium]|nr:sodium:proton antiporter [Ignavibacteriaceae bacterium]